MLKTEKDWEKDQEKDQEEEVAKQEDLIEVPKDKLTNYI